MLIRNLMTQNPRTCNPTDNLDVAARHMWEADCGALPIVDEAGKLVGIVTDRDICMAAYTQGRPLRDILVAVAMARQVITCRPDDDIDVAEASMRRVQIRRLPVVSAQGQLVGILSLNDLARETQHDGSHEGPPKSADVAETLATICEPRFALATATT